MSELLNWTIAFFIVCTLFVSLSLLAVWTWRGRSYRSRFWTRQHLGPTLPLAAFPLFALFSLSVIAGLLGAPDFLVRGIILGGTAVGIWGMMVYLAGTFWWPAQRLWGPRWWVRQSREAMEEQLFNGTDPFHDGLSRIGAPSADSRKLYWLGDSLRRWHGARLMDPVHSSRRDRFFGDLWVCEEGVWFDLPGASTEVQDTVSVAVPWGQVQRVYAVRGSENVAGERVMGVLDRSGLGRLTLTTSEGDFLFEVAFWRAAQAARFITEEKERWDAR